LLAIDLDVEPYRTVATPGTFALLSLGLVRLAAVRLRIYLSTVPPGATRYPGIVRTVLSWSPHGASHEPPTADPTRMDKLTCELCSGDRFEPVYLTDTQRTPLLACRQCRLVFLPRPDTPSGTSVPRPPDLSRYGPLA